jgi:hypothetical protein
MEVYLFGQVFAGRLCRVHEVTRIRAGDETLKDLGTAME